MDSVFWYQVAGLFGAVLLQTGFCGVALTLSRQRWPLALLAMILIVSSALSLQAFIEMKFAVVALTSLIVVAGNVLFFRHVKSDKRALTPLSWFALTLIALTAAYAAFPDYRYDQWSYHLLVGKQIVRAGPFALPIIYDHIFFSGTYEYLTAIPRLFWDNDLFAHCFSNGFSFLIFVSCLFGLVKLFSEAWEIDRRLILPLTAAILFSIPDSEVLVSSKPDPLLICYALAVLYLMLCDHVPQRTRNVLLALFIAGPAAFKLTWVHFSVSVSGAWLALAVVKKYPVSFATVRQLAVGGLVAFTLSLPFLLKNYQFFGNPVHPVQAAFFKSEFWTPGFAAYWLEVSGKALNAGEYFAMLPRLPIAYGKVNAWLLALCLILLVASWRAVAAAWKSMSREVLIWSVTLVCFLLLWPLFYRNDIYPRFVYPVLAVAISALLLFCGRFSVSKRLALVFLLPLLFNASMEVKLYRIARAYAAPDEFFDNGRLPYRHWTVARLLNEHRARTFPGAGYREHRVLSDSHIGYFLDTERLDITSPDFTWFRVEVTKATGDDCIWHLAKLYDVNYIQSVFNPFNEWPAEFRELIDAAIPVGEGDHVLYLSDETIESNIARCTQ